MEFSLHKADFLEAVQIVSWEYPAPYEVYSLHGSPLAIAKLVDGQYFGVYNHNQLVGFFCYGEAAQLAGYDRHLLYQDKQFLDVGLGMHPDYCGRGLGASFVRAGLVYAREQSWLGAFRLTVASNNPRAITVYSRLGFQEVGRIVWDASLDVDFLVMTLDSFEPSSAAAQAD